MSLVAEGIKSLVWALGLVVVCATCVWVCLRAIRNIRHSLSVKDWLVVTWNVVVSVVSVAGCLACLYFV